MQLQDLLGRPIHSKEVKEFLARCGLPSNPTPNYDSYGNLFWVRATNDEKGVESVFMGYVRYAPAYGEPIGSYNKEKDQLILHEISVYPEKAGGNSVVDLPFGLNLGDDKKTVEEKIGKKLTGKCKTDYGFGYDAFFEEFRLIVALNFDERLSWIRLFKLELNEKERARLKARLRSQNKNIDPSRIPEIQALGAKTPMAAWRKRMVEGDDMFSEQSIAAVEAALASYAQTLCEATQKKSASAVYSRTAKLVKALNKINDKYGLIETVEREELWEWIDALVRKTGLELGEDVDITEEWREW